MSEHRLRHSRFRGMVAAMLRIRLHWFGCALTAVLVVAAVGSATTEERPDFCGDPPAKDAAELLPLAEAGDAEAQYILGHQYRFGGGPRRDQEMAATWFRRAAEQGHLEAIAALGVMHVQGNGVPKDIAEGLRLMRRAAIRGHVCSQAALGVYHMMGYFDVAQDLDKAEKWLRKAAEEEYSVAHRMLAELHSGRFGGEAEFVEALRWAIIREKFHPHDRIPKLIREIRDRILPLMTPQQIAEAERRANDWLARHGK